MTFPRALVPIPASKDAERTTAALQEAGPWFYEFDFANGATSAAIDDVAQEIHATRAELIFPFLDQYYAQRWHQIRCVDIACNEGWFAMQVAARGAQEVQGFDLRPEHIERANLIKSLSDLRALRFTQGDLFELDTEAIGAFDLTLCLGLLYHLDGHMPALRRARALTRGMCVIETQVARSTGKMMTNWGSGEVLRGGGGIAVVPADDIHAEAGLEVSLVPSIDALYQMLYAVGFTSVQLAVAAPNAYSQFVDFDRVVVFAQTPGRLTV